MALFGKKKEAPESFSAPTGEMGPPPGMPQGTPKDAVMQMRQQGMSNYQIIQDLQNQGYNSQQIFDAMNSADPMNIPAGPLPGMGPDMQMQQPSFGAPEQPMMQSPAPSMADAKGAIEEMAEAIIDEKWEELVKSINKVIEWKEKSESQLAKLEQELKDLKDNYNQLHTAVVGKLSEYDQNVVNVSSDLKAMEKVFQKVLPTFTDNINELNRVVKSMKKK